MPSECRHAGLELSFTSTIPRRIGRRLEVLHPALARSSVALRSSTASNSSTPVGGVRMPPRTCDIFLGLSWGGQIGRGAVRPGRPTGRQTALRGVWAYPAAPYFGPCPTEVARTHRGKSHRITPLPGFWAYPAARCPPKISRQSVPRILEPTRARSRAGGSSSIGENCLAVGHG